MTDEQTETPFDKITNQVVRVSNREIWEKPDSMERTAFNMDQRMNILLEENVTLHKRLRALEWTVYGDHD